MSGEPIPMRKTPMVLAVLSIVFGALTVLASLFQLVVPRLMEWATRATSELGGEGTPELKEQLADTHELMEATRSFLLWQGCGFLVFSLALIVIGVGLYRRRRWSRRASVGWGSAALLWLALTFGFQILVVQPRTEALEQRNARDLPPAIARITTSKTARVVSALGAYISYLPFPIVLIALMGRPSAKNDFPA